MAVVLAACAGASGEVPGTAVAGVQVVRDAAPTTSTTPPTTAAPTTTAAPPTTAAPTTTAAPAPPTTTAPPTSRVRAAKVSGEQVRTEVIGGVERRWTVVVPPGAQSGDQLPILIVLHGVGGAGTTMKWVGFDQMAATRNAIVVYPDATGGSWNDGRPGMEPLSGTPVDDVAFLRTLIDRVAGEFGGDTGRVSVVGFSNGALMASRLACDMPERLRAAVMVSGAGPRDVAQRCRPSQGLPVMVVFGTSDATVPYGGGQVASFGGKSRGQVASVREVLDVWRKANGCAANDVQEVVSATPVVQSVRPASCQSDVLHYCIVNGKHEWIANSAFNTTTEAWKFVVAHWA